MEAIFDEAKGVYRVEKPDGSFDTYTPSQFRELGGKVGEVEEETTPEETVETTPEETVETTPEETVETTPEETVDEEDDGDDETNTQE